MRWHSLNVFTQKRRSSLCNYSSQEQRIYICHCLRMPRNQALSMWGIHAIAWRSMRSQQWYDIGTAAPQTRMVSAPFLCRRWSGIKRLTGRLELQLASTRSLFLRNSIFPHIRLGLCVPPCHTHFEHFVIPLKLFIKAQVHFYPHDTNHQVPFRTFQLFYFGLTHFCVGPWQWPNLELPPYVASEAVQKHEVRRRGFGSRKEDVIQETILRLTNPNLRYLM